MKDKDAKEVAGMVASQSECPMFRSCWLRAAWPARASYLSLYLLAVVNLLPRNHIHLLWHLEMMAAPRLEFDTYHMKSV
jgi:hypothetical protein